MITLDMPGVPIHCMLCAWVLLLCVVHNNGACTHLCLDLPFFKCWACCLIRENSASWLHISHGALGDIELAINEIFQVTIVCKL